MKKIGILYGMENSFPEAVVNYINQKKSNIYSAEYLQIGGIKMNELFQYDVILDRASHEVPFYRSFLKLACLNGVYVVNNPFWSCADDNFFNVSLANKINIKVPRTVLLPSKEHPIGTTSDNMRNLKFPLNWDELFQYVGFPAYIKSNYKNPHITEYKVYNPQEFFSAYDLTGNLPMLLQESIEFEHFYKCVTIGKKEVIILNYDPMKPLHLRYASRNSETSPQLKSKLEEICIKICTSIGFDFNSIEFAIKKDEPYPIEFANPVPYFEKQFMDPVKFDAVVSKTGDFLIELTKSKKDRKVCYNWMHFLKD